MHLHFFYSKYKYNHTQELWSGGPELNFARKNHAVGFVFDEDTEEKFLLVTGGDHAKAGPAERIST